VGENETLSSGKKETKNKRGAELDRKKNTEHVCGKTTSVVASERRQRYHGRVEERCTWPQLHHTAQYSANEYGSSSRALINITSACAVVECGAPSTSSPPTERP
jgi:hypothetical protein